MFFDVFVICPTSGLFETQTALFNNTQYLSITYTKIAMIFDINPETKMQLSDNIVRHCRFAVSAKASAVLRYFSQPFLRDDLIVDWSKGITYFSGFATKNFDTTERKANQELTEIITILPKWLFSAHTKCDEIHTIRLDRDASGQYSTTCKPLSTSDYFAQLRALHLASGQTHQASQSDAAQSFEGGLAGFIGYDLAAQQHVAAQSVEPSDSERLIAAIGDYDIFLKKEAEGWALYGSDDPCLAPLIAQIISVFKNFESVLTITSANAQLITETNLGSSTPTNPFRVKKPFKPSWSFDEYAAAFQRIQDYLRAGDCYQVNLTQPFIATVEGDLLDVMDDLFALTRAPYSGYMCVGQHELLSCSPELFLAFSGEDEQGNNQVITRPIKGTRPRSDNTVQDKTERDALIHSEKDHSENLMIVDLLRNDLSLHAVVGSVTVPALFELESFAQVHHLVSEIRATLSADVSPLDVLIDALPGGSITGAPKKRAMEIIAELEAAPRGAYCGSFGFLNRDGSGQFNVLIRTLQKHQDQLIAWAGGGITIASEVEAEYQECLDKIS
ncbi:MAG TPA: anthranilate synthase component I family protein, partial [Aquirhabdus sp.]